MDRLIYKEADGDLTCRSRDFEKIFPTLYAYEELELTPQEIEQQLTNFSSFLMEMTGGRMSKTNYTVQAMVDEAYDYSQKQLDEAEQKGYDLGVDSVLRNHFDIPWDEAADLRKNIDHLRELLEAEKNGRLLILPCKTGDKVWAKIPSMKSPIPGRIYSIVEEELKGEKLIFFRCALHGYFSMSFPLEDIGKTVFLTQEEAEAAFAGEKEG